MDDVVNSFKALSYFGELSLSTKEALLKTAIRYSQEYTFKSLADILESLTVAG